MNRDEKKLYIINKLSYNLVMWFVLINTVHAIFTLQNMTVNLSLGIFILATIGLTMVSFLGAVKLQTYSRNWSYISIAIGGFQLFKIIIQPEEIQGNLATYLTLMLLVSAVFVIVGGIISLMRINKRSNYLREHYKGNEVIH